MQHPTAGRLRAEGDASVAYLPQQHHTTLPLTVAEVLTMGRYRARGLLRPMRARDRATVAAAAVRLRVDDLVHRRFGELSGGQRQRVRVASMLANEARCLLLDEPITGLDLPSQEIIFEVFAHERARGRLVVMSTHHIDEVRRCDRVVLLAHGTVVADGAPDDVVTAENLATAFGVRLLAVVPPAAPDADDPDAGRPVPSFALVDDHGHGGHGDHDDAAAPAGR
ncbi:MAG TPA: metal ABC transporter ATP-binding protein [Acidimicrobiaceae bacterium]|nr:metal ABC transporter ATP-binding protein [Acidimicrobiaceae bacterium]